MSAIYWTNIKYLRVVPLELAMKSAAIVCVLNENLHTAQRSVHERRLLSIMQSVHSYRKPIKITNTYLGPQASHQIYRTVKQAIPSEMFCQTRAGQLCLLTTQAAIRAGYWYSIPLRYQPQ